MTNMAARPSFSLPTRKPLAPSKFMTQVAEALMPILCSIEPGPTALRSPTEPSALTINFGTMKSEIPREPAGASGVLAKTK